MSSIFTQPLLALDLTHIAIMLVLLFFGVMKQLFDASKDANKKKPAGNPGPRPPQLQPQPGQPRPVQAGGQADPLRSQVEEFLRRASQSPEKKDRPLQQPQGRPPSAIELLVEGEDRLRSSASAAAARAAAGMEKKRPARRPKRQSVAEHVEQQVAARSQSIAQKASNLGQRIVHEDQHFDDQLKAKFEHRLGSLAASDRPTEQPAATPVTPAAQIAAMLANPDGVRQAVVLNEILRRPSDRW